MNNEKELTHIDLFSGIGGFTLAAEWAGFKTIVFCEKEEFCQKIIRKHWPEVPIIHDIKELTELSTVDKIESNEKRIFRSDQNVRNGAVNSGHSNVFRSDKAINVDEPKKEKLQIQIEDPNGDRESFLSRNDSGGQGSKCSRESNRKGNHSEEIPLRKMRRHRNIQRRANKGPVSSSGLSKTIGSKLAMSEMSSRMAQKKQAFKIINENKITHLTAGVPCQPTSDAGKRGGKTDARWLWPETLEAIRLIKPTWCLLENVCGFLSLEGGLEFEQVCLDLENQGYEIQSFIIPACGLNAPHKRNRVWIVANSQTEGLSWSIIKKDSQKEIQRGMANISGEPNSSSRHIWDVPDSETNRHPNNINAQGFREERNSKDSIRLHNRENSAWQENWLEVATRFCRVDDGVSDRIHRLKALGNAIVPQIAFQIIKMIAQIERGNNEL